MVLRAMTLNIAKMPNAVFIFASYEIRTRRLPKRAGDEELQLKHLICTCTGPHPSLSTPDALALLSMLSCTWGCEEGTNSSGRSV